MHAVLFSAVTSNDDGVLLCMLAIVLVIYAIRPVYRKKSDVLDETCTRSIQPPTATRGKARRKYETRLYFGRRVHVLHIPKDDDEDHAA